MDVDSLYVSHWFCKPCHVLVHGMRQLGLTSKDPIVCEACGEERICVLTRGEDIEEARKILAEEKE